MSAECIRLSHEMVRCVTSLEHMLDQVVVYTVGDFTAYSLSWNFRKCMKIGTGEWTDRPNTITGIGLIKGTYCDFLKHFLAAG